MTIKTLPSWLRKLQHREQIFKNIHEAVGDLEGHFKIHFDGHVTICRDDSSEDVVYKLTPEEREVFFSFKPHHLRTRLQKGE